MKTAGSRVNNGNTLKFAFAFLALEYESNESTTGTDETCHVRLATGFAAEEKEESFFLRCSDP